MYKITIKIILSFGMDIRAGGIRLNDRGKRTAAFILTAMTAFMLCLSGCGSTQQRSTSVNVKAMKVIQQDVNVSHEYSGEIKSANEVTIKPMVSGTIVAKYFESGAMVQQGQPLYKIDDRQYEQEVYSARSNLDKAITTLNNSQIDLQRYQSLVATGAISEQTVTTQQATVATNQSNVDDMHSALRKAEERLEDTIIRAPMSGKLSVDDVANGTYATAGNTSLVSIGQIHPIYVQFSISENEYLNFRTQGSSEGGRPQEIVPPTCTLTLSNGTKLDETSNSYIVDRALSAETGTLTIKASFENSNSWLLPGMFAKVSVAGSPQKDALLVPQKAVQQVLDKSFVIVVGIDGKSVTKTVELGDQLGSYYIIKSGLEASDTVVVEGLTNLKEGQLLNVTMTTPEELGLTMSTDTATTTSQE